MKTKRRRQRAFFDRVTLEEFMSELSREDIWKPDFSRMSKRLDVPVSTLYDNFIRMRADGRLDIHLNIEVMMEESDDDER